MVARSMRLLQLVVPVIGGHRAVALENIALRHQLAMDQRTRPRPVVRSSDLLFWVGLRRFWSEWTSALVILRPATVIR
jgi:hypothetical protein